MAPTDLAKYIKNYLVDYLGASRNLSLNTIASRRDTFKLLFEYFTHEKGLPPDKVNIPDLSAESISDFLRWLEYKRGSSESTRNLRLAGIKAFFRYIQSVTPDYIFQSQQIFGIPLKKKFIESIEYMTLDGIEAILSVISTNSVEQRRDSVLMSILYDCAPRAQEICDLCVGDLRLQKPETARFVGKGNRARIVPLMTPTSALLKQYVVENHLSAVEMRVRPLFTNRSGHKLTRAGIAYIVDKYANYARIKYPSLIPKCVSPHHFRHSRAMHMLQAGVPLIYIRDFLGHVEISTTEIYAKCDSKQKREAFEAVQPIFTKNCLPVWKQDESLLSWLNSLC